MKDWSGNGNSVFKAIGASSHCNEERAEQDYYATSPEAIDGLVQMITLPDHIWEPACGAGHLSKRLIELGYKVTSTDIVDRGFCDKIVDFLTFPLLYDITWQYDCILTNPPYKYATEFVLRALELLPERGLCCMFLKTTFLEGKARRKMLYDRFPPKYVLQFSERVLCGKNGNFDKVGGSAVAYAWFVWEKGYKGDTIIKWI